jgi:low temperature requirement protein LtrA
MLLGIVTLAAGVRQALESDSTTLPYRACLALAGGVALFLAGDVAFRRALRIGAQRYRIVAATAALAVSPVGTAFSVTAEIALLTAIVASALITERLLEVPGNYSVIP